VPHKLKEGASRVTVSFTTYTVYLPQLRQHQLWYTSDSTHLSRQRASHRSRSLHY
jgi:hypothetical protein